MSAAAAYRDRISEIVTAVAQHRTLTTTQVWKIELPNRGRRWAQIHLARARERGLLESVSLPASSELLWFVTEAGAEIAQRTNRNADPPKLLSGDQAIGQLHAHTLAVSDVALCFLRAARERGDEFGPLSWRHEVAHPLAFGRGRRPRFVVADAVLTYMLTADGDDGVSLVHRFLELDRATEAVDRLAAGLGRYADLYRAEREPGQPAWQELYPVFPSVLCVLTGAPRDALERRRMAVLALLEADPRLASLPAVAISVGLLEDLQERGPFAPIFDELTEPGQRVDWLGTHD
jgi:hypothetical protein